MHPIYSSTNSAAHLAPQLVVDRSTALGKTSVTDRKDDTFAKPASNPITRPVTDRLDYPSDQSPIADTAVSLAAAHSIGHFDCKFKLGLPQSELPQLKLSELKPPISSPFASRVFSADKSPPLHWWRVVKLEQFSIHDQMLLKKSIMGFSILGEPAWRQAAKGSSSAAIGCALRAFTEWQNDTSTNENNNENRHVESKATAGENNPSCKNANTGIFLSSNTADNHLYSGTNTEAQDSQSTSLFLQLTSPPPRVDLAMSALLLCAHEGDATCKLVLAYLMKRYHALALAQFQADVTACFADILFTETYFTNPYPADACLDKLRLANLCVDDLCLANTFLANTLLANPCLTDTQPTEVHRTNIDPTDPHPTDTHLTDTCFADAHLIDICINTHHSNDIVFTPCFSNSVLKRDSLKQYLPCFKHSLRCFKLPYSKMHTSCQPQLEGLL